jgi:hypothetical protein
LAGIPSGQLPALLKHWDPSKATRDEVREKVKLWATDGEGDGKGDTDKDARAKRRERKEIDGPLAFERHCFEAKKLLDGDETGPKAADSCQGTTILELAFMIILNACEQQREKPWWTEAMLKQIRGGLERANAAVAEIGGKLGY